MPSRQLSQLFLICGLLLLQFALRTHQPDLQHPYVDEGFHIARALRIYDFEENPARTSHGKLLLYFWMGLFDTDNDRTMLPTARLSIALISLVSGAGIYLLGRIFANHIAGLIALTLYIFTPHAMFYERMALADPLASALMILVIWRCYVLAKHPTAQQGIIAGAVIALSTLAKLTMGLAVLFPLIAALIYGTHKRTFQQWLRAYTIPFVLSGITFLIIWSPFGVPGLLARNSDDPYILVNSYNVERTENDPDNAIEYLQILAPNADDFLLPYTVIIVLIAGVVMAWQASRHMLYIYLWFFAITILLPLFSRLVSMRYFMPTAAPLVLIVVLVLVGQSRKPKQLWRMWVSRVIRGIVGLAVLGWLALHAVPFAYTTITAPLDLPFGKINWTEYTSGYLTTNEAFQQMADDINQRDDDLPLYAPWKICHLMFFYVEDDINCFPERRAGSGLRNAIRDQNAGESFWLLISGYSEYWDDWDYVDYELLIQHDPDRINRPVFAYKMTYRP